MQTNLNIRIDDLTGPEIAAFLEDHIADMKATSPPESKHALDLDGLRQPEITFWTVWDDSVLVGCGAIKALDNTHAELKSMRTLAARRGSGVGSVLLAHILQFAKNKGYTRLSLETGAFPFFAPAWALYQKFGFEKTTPFAGYSEDPNSVFMTKVL